MCRYTYTHIFHHQAFIIWYANTCIVALLCDKLSSRHPPRPGRIPTYNPNCGIEIHLATLFFRTISNIRRALYKSGMKDVWKSTYKCLCMYWENLKIIPKSNFIFKDMHFMRKSVAYIWIGIKMRSIVNFKI